MISKVTIVAVTVLGYAFATNYGGRYGGDSGDASASGYARDESGGHRDTHSYPPKPYQFRYSAGDEQGNSHYRNEQSDESGTVRGTYGYRDAQGLYRVVQYVADARGFRANITTNEPGTDGKVNPASVNIVAEKPPAGIQDRGTKAGGAGGYGGGYGGASGGGAGLPPVYNVTGAVQNTACDIGEDYDIELCLQAIGSG